MILFRNAVLCAAMFTVAAHAVHAQKIIGEVHDPRGWMRDFQLTSAGDSVLFSYVHAGEAGKMKVSQWIRNDGTLNRTFFAQDILAISRSKGHTYYYYIDEVEKQEVIRAIAYDSTVNRAADHPGYVPIEGRLVDVFMGENPVIITYQRRENKIVVREINGLDVVHEQKFIPPVDLSDYVSKSSPPEFYSLESQLNTFKGDSKVRFYWYDRLYVSVDDTYIPSRSVSRERKTHLFAFHGQDSVEHMVFPIETIHGFRSFVLDGMLFRSMTSRRHFVLTVYDLETRAQLAADTIEREQSDFDVYIRSGKKNEIRRDGASRRMMGYSSMHVPLLIVHRAGRSGEYIIQWGTYYNEKGMGGLGGLGPTPAGFLTMLTVTAIKQMAERPGLSVYFYSQWRRDGTFVAHKDTVGLLREDIDNYEIEMASEKKGDLQYKGYIDHNGGVVAVYYLVKQDKARLVYFDRRLQSQ